MIVQLECKVSANEGHENLFSDGREPPNFCKVSANEGHENLFSDGREPPNFCKVRTIICKSKAKTQ